MGCRECHSRRTYVSAVRRDLLMTARQAEREARLLGRPSEQCLADMAADKRRLSDARAADEEHRATCD